jgi:hypothetical protein
MGYVPCRDRTFIYQIDILKLLTPYLRWIRHLSERLGVENTLSLWETSFVDYDEKYLLRILSSSWQIIPSKETNDIADKIDDLVREMISPPLPDLSAAKVLHIIENTPPILQIRNIFTTEKAEKEMSAYDALHLRFDGLAHLAETLIKSYGKQGELIVYDLMIEGRLASSQGETGSVSQFITDFALKPDKPNLFTAGIEFEKISETSRELIINIRECEWARYFQERHPSVGYLMACSTDEVAYKSYNKNLRMQRTQTIMEGNEKCDFRIYTISDSQEA